MQKKEFIYLPLYSERSNGVLYVPPKSGLNAGRASGRKRKKAETYVRIPSWIHRVFNGFFPGPDISFKLKLRRGKILNAKVCQASRKALMSDPNIDLLDEVIQRIGDMGRPYVIADLYNAGIDSVKVSKTSIKPLAYSMELASVDSFESFQRTHNEVRRLKGRSKSSGIVYGQEEVMRLTKLGIFYPKKGSSVGSVSPGSRSVLRKEFERSAAVIESALSRANGVCEVCLKNGPFKCLDGKYFLEVHHVIPLSDGGEDTLYNVAAVCPNCHRACHFSNEKDSLAAMLSSKFCK